jgi:phage-related tail fiber protein
MADFKTIHTTLGLAAMAAAEATGTPVTLTEMAVGDGNGNAVTPTEGMTNLVREMFRASINRVFQSPTDPNRFTAELVIPATAGGFVLREVGVFDADGSLFAVGNLPDTYKPMASEGAFADTVVRLEFMVTNASVVTLQIDPSVAVATQQWISNHVTAAFMIPGGTTHQILRKKSNADGDTEWADPTDANVVVDTVEEQQTLAAAQTAVTLTATTTYGLSLYIEGVRLRNDQWTPHPTDETKLTLAASYPAGTKLTAVQNEPAGSAPAPLVKALNLSDVPSKATARTNLDVYSKAEADQKAPAGAVVHFARSSAPTGWLKANGAAVSRTAYASLFAAIGTAFGAGDGFNTFNLPDLRGEFVRGWDDARGIDASRAFGSAQADELRAHTHTTTVNRDRGATTAGNAVYGDEDYYGQNTLETSSTGGAETRPRNIALLACIKF